MTGTLKEVNMITNNGVNEKIIQPIARTDVVLQEFFSFSNLK